MLMHFSSCAIWSQLQSKVHHALLQGYSRYADHFQQSRAQKRATLTVRSSDWLARYLPMGSHTSPFT